jgi:hypothetical protein
VNQHSAAERLAPVVDIYSRNIQIAASRVEDLVLEASPDLDPKSLGAVARSAMESIHRSDVRTATTLNDPAAYRALAQLIVAGLGDQRRKSR